VRQSAEGWQEGAVGLWRDRALRFLAGASGTILIALFGAARNKWLATYLDTAGVGIVSQIAAGQGWLGTLVGLGLGLPVTRAVAARSAAGDDAGARRAAWTGFSLAAPAAVFVGTLGLWLAPQLSTALLGTPDHATLVRVSMLGVIGIGLYQVIQGMAAGRSDVRAPLALALGGVAVTALLTFVLVPRFGLVGAVVATSLLYPAACVTLLAIHRRRYPQALTPRPRPIFDSREARALLSVSGAALLLPLADQGTLLALRAHFLRLHGVSANGLLQAALALSQQVGALFYAYLASYAFGMISGAGGARGAAGIADYTRRQWTPLVLFAALTFAIAIVGASPLLHLLYSSRFDPARRMMACALFGEFGRVCLQAAALGALPLGGSGLWLRIGLVQPVSLAAGYAVFTAAGTGELALPLAYAAAGVVTFAAGAVMMARAGVFLGPRRLMIAGACYAALAVLVRATI
jgi:O-antigen/teichoic acid export membrane protein